MERKFKFSVDEYYHLYNRGAGKANIFLNEADYRRFGLLLLTANQASVIHLSGLLKNPKYQGPSLVEIFKDEVPEERLVDIVAYCPMPNHFHLVVRERVEGGVSMFMKKVMTGYAMYFNKKYEHSGVLFQGRFQAKHIDNDAYLRHIFAYVHINPIEMVLPKWKEGTISKSDIKKAIAFLNLYKHSSYFDFFLGNRSESTILSGVDELPWKEDYLKPERLFDWYLGDL